MVMDPEIAATDRRAERAESRRQRLLQAASLCFAEKGFKAVTLDEVAWAADMSKPSIYTHYAGKDELIDAVLEAAVEDWSSETAARAVGEDSAAAALGARIRASVRFASENPILRKIMQQDRLTLLAGHSAHFRRAQAASLAAAEHLLSEGVASGEFRVELDVAQTSVAFELIHFALVEAALGLREAETSDALMGATITMLLDGLRRGTQ
jgi:AcrR family transcriptional regulator